MWKDKIKSRAMQVSTVLAIRGDYGFYNPVGSYSITGLAHA
jgi:hypothetical protein